MTSPGLVGTGYEFSGAPPASERQKVEWQVSQMEYARQQMLPWWRELGAYFAPRAPRLDVWKENRGNGLNRHILDETTVYAKRTLASGLHWGITNPSRTWKELAHPDPDVAEREDIAIWLHTVNQRMDTVLARSNFYDTMAAVYDELVVFGNSAYLVERDDTDVIRCVPVGIGSWAVSDDAKGNPTAFSRYFLMTIRQLVEEFGTVNGKPSDRMFSQRVKDAIKNKKWEEKVEVVHLIAPNADFDGRGETPERKRWASYYYEQGSTPVDPAMQFLRKDGYDEWPVMVFRWRRVADEPYGVDCPGMMVLGTAKSIQQVERKALRMVDKAVDPPLVGPSSLQNRRVSLLPGDVTTDDEQGRLRAIHDVNLGGLQAVRETQLDMRERIMDAFYTRLMLLISNNIRTGNRTAREIEEGSQEKYLVLGTVLESFNRVFSLLIDRVFAEMLRRGLIPPPPPDMEGVALKVEYTSIMAQAQKSVGLNNIERFAASVANLVNITGDRSIATKVDWEQLVDEMGIRSSIPPRIVRSDEDVAEIRQAEAEQARAMQAAEQAKVESEVARNLASAKTNEENALTDVMAASGNSLPAQVTGGRL